MQVKQSPRRGTCAKLLEQITEPELLFLRKDRDKIGHKRSVFGEHFLKKRPPLSGQMDLYRPPIFCAPDPFHQLLAFEIVNHHRHISAADQLLPAQFAQRQRPFVSQALKGAELGLRQTERPDMFIGPPV
jgi:hypothetical protein